MSETAHVTFTGDIDVFRAADFSAQLARAVDSSANGTLVVDLTAVRFIDGAVVDALDRAERQARSRGVVVTVLTNDRIDRMLELFRLGTIAVNGGPSRGIAFPDFVSRLDAELAARRGTSRPLALQRPSETSAVWSENGGRLGVDAAPRGIRIWIELGGVRHDFEEECDELAVRRVAAVFGDVNTMPAAMRRP